MPHSPKGRHYELIALVIVVSGIFLLSDFRPILAALRSGFSVVADRGSAAFWLGLILIGGGLLFLGYRLRVRFLRSAYWHATTCPRCGSSLHMIHRRWYDRFFGRVFLPHARRYRCANATCRWTGLRHVIHHSRSA